MLQNTQLHDKTADRGNMTVNAVLTRTRLPPCNLYLNARSLHHNAVSSPIKVEQFFFTNSEAPKAVGHMGTI